MKNRQVIVFLIVLSIYIFVFTRSAESCWVGLTTAELIQKSDVILIGDIIGPVAVGKGNPQRIDDYWMTHWKLLVHYYLKGNHESTEFYVVTPGAQNKSPQTSLDFRLDKTGKTVILFLRQREGLYEPLSPQGIISLRKTGYVRKTDETINGELILKEFQFDNQQSSDLEKFISDNNSVLISKDVPTKQQIPKEPSNLPLIAGLFVLSVFVIFVIAYIGKRFRKE